MDSYGNKAHRSMLYRSNDVLYLVNGNYSVDFIYSPYHKKAIAFNITTHNFIVFFKPFYNGTPYNFSLNFIQTQQCIAKQIAFKVVHTNFNVDAFSHCL